MATIYDTSWLEKDANQWIRETFTEYESSYSAKIDDCTVKTETVQFKTPNVAKIKKPRYPTYKKNDRVNTPSGQGSIWSVDKDGTVCVELDNDPSVLHEFEKKEIKKIRTKSKK